MKGYDIDGVITAGIIPDRDGVIITGRSYEEAPETYRMLHSKGFYNAVFFNSKTFFEKDPLNSGWHKAEMINKLKVTQFYEDEDRQIAIIKENTKCKIIKC